MVVWIWFGLLLRRRVAWRFGYKARVLFCFVLFWKAEDTYVHLDGGFKSDF